MREGKTTLTDPASGSWSPAVAGYARWEKSVRIGAGEEHWRWACDQLLSWGIKTRSGFRVTPVMPVAPAQEPLIRVRVFRYEVLEPVRVCAVVNTARRVGFAYQTLPGHPVSGEECFILEHRDAGIFLSIRSLTKPAPVNPWRTLYPLLRVAQVFTRWRYFRALKRK